MASKKRGRGRAASSVKRTRTTKEVRLSSATLRRIEAARRAYLEAFSGEPATEAARTLHRTLRRAGYSDRQSSAHVGQVTRARREHLARIVKARAGYLEAPTRREAETARARLARVLERAGYTARTAGTFIGSVTALRRQGRPRLEAARLLYLQASEPHGSYVLAETLAAAKEALKNVFLSLGYSPRQAAARVGFATRQRTERFLYLAVLHQQLMGPRISIDIMTLRYHQETQTDQYRQFMSMAMALGLDYRQAINEWFSPKVLPGG